jgi:hypothetical protein
MNMRIDAIVLLAVFDDGYCTEGVYTADGEEDAFADMMQLMGDKNRARPDCYMIRLEKATGGKQVLQRWESVWSQNSDQYWMKA